MRRAAAALACLALGAGAAGSGWRIDGRGVLAVDVPAGDATPRWSVTLPTWGNGSPVAAAGRVCLTHEPTTLLCLDAATGAVAWRARHDVADALTVADAAAARAAVAAADAADAAVVTLSRDYARLLREARSGAASAATALSDTQARLAAAKAQVEAAHPYRTPPAEASVGWSVATPVTDGVHVWALFGNGVVSCFTLDGRRVWMRWLGPHVAKLRGYDGTPTASPRLVDGVLVVGYNLLYGLDAHTGATRWTSGTYDAYGTPATGAIGGVAFVVSPTGRVVRARDGQLVSSSVTQALYTSPLVDDGRAWFFASDEGGGWKATATAWTITASGDSLSVARAWNTVLPSTERVYTSPVRWGNRLVSFGKDGSVWQLDASTGAVLSDASFDLPAGREVWTSPLVTPTSLLLWLDSGELRRFTGADLRPAGAWRVPGAATHATPFVSGDVTIVRGPSTVIRAR